MTPLRVYDRRLLTIGYRLAVAAAPLCSNAVPASGFTLVDLAQFDRRDRPMATGAYRLTDHPAVLAVAPRGQPTPRGLEEDDALLAIDGEPVARQRPHGDPLGAIRQQMAGAATDSQLTLKLRRDGVVRTLTYRPEAACPAQFEIGRSDTPDAAVSGTVVQVNIGLMNFTDDEGLAGVIAHELAHIALGSEEGNNRDHAVAREQEEAADRLSVLILRRAGYGVDGIVSFWRRMAAGEGGRYRTRQHLPPLERAAAIEAEAARLAAGQPAMPR